MVPKISLTARSSRKFGKMIAHASPRTKLPAQINLLCINIESRNIEWLSLQYQYSGFFLFSSIFPYEV